MDQGVSGREYELDPLRSENSAPSRIKAKLKRVRKLYLAPSLPSRTYELSEFQLSYVFCITPRYRMPQAYELRLR